MYLAYQEFIKKYCFTSLGLIGWSMFAGSPYKSNAPEFSSRRKVLEFIIYVVYISKQFLESPDMEMKGVAYIRYSKK